LRILNGPRNFCVGDVASRRNRPAPAGFRDSNQTSGASTMGQGLMHTTAMQLIISRSVERKVLMLAKPIKGPGLITLYGHRYQSVNLITTNELTCKVANLRTWCGSCRMRHTRAPDTPEWPGHARGWLARWRANFLQLFVCDARNRKLS